MFISIIQVAAARQPPQYNKKWLYCKQVEMFPKLTYDLTMLYC